MEVFRRISSKQKTIIFVTKFIHSCKLRISAERRIRERPEKRENFSKYGINILQPTNAYFDIFFDSS